MSLVGPPAVFHYRQQKERGRADRVTNAAPVFEEDSHLWRLTLLFERHLMSSKHSGNSVFMSAIISFPVDFAVDLH